MLGLKELLLGGKLSRGSLLYRFLAYIHGAEKTESLTDSCELRAALLTGTVKGGLTLLGILTIVGIIIAFLGAVIIVTIEQGWGMILSICTFIVAGLAIGALIGAIDTAYTRYAWTRPLIKGIGYLILAPIAAFIVCFIVVVLGVAADLGLVIPHALGLLLGVELNLSETMLVLTGELFVGLAAAFTTVILAIEVAYAALTAIGITQRFYGWLSQTRGFLWVKGYICFEIELTN